MNPLWRNFKTDWPAWAVIAFVALMPFRRLMEVPLALFAFSFFYLLGVARHRRTIQRLLPFTGVLFLCFWLPVLASNFASYDPGKSLSTSLWAWRYGAAALAIGVWLQPARLRSLALKGCAIVVLFWVLDGFVQVMIGHDLFGFPRHPDRLNALFGDRHQFFGPVLAMLASLPIEYSRRHWPGWVTVGIAAAAWAIVLLAGMRAGWLAMAVVTAVYLLVMLQSRKPVMRRMAILLPILAAVVALGLYAGSSSVRERANLSLLMFAGNSDAFEEGSSYRLSLWRAALDMYRSQPVTGIGVRAYPEAFKVFAPADDPHQLGNAIGDGGSHAHNIILEVASATGTLGLVGLVLIYFVGWRGWLRATRASRREALPWALVVFAITFPLNSHFAIYGVFTSSMIWMFVGMWGASLRLPVKQS